MAKKFPSELNSRGTVKVTDKLLISNIDTGDAEYTTIDEILDALGIKGQVKFPATQVPSAGANTLDDYEEGEWTMGMSFGDNTTDITYSANTGYYTKIGNIAIATGQLILTSKGSASGVAKITGLPYNINNNKGASFSASLQTTNITFASQLMSYGIIGGKTIQLCESTEAGVVSTLTDADFADNSDLTVSCVYRVE